MIPRVHALVVSPDIAVFRHIQAAFRDSHNVELSLRTDWSLVSPFKSTANVLIVYGDSPSQCLRQLRKHGYQQPALILVPESQHSAIVPLEDDLRPLENVTWAVMRAGGLRQCAEMMVESARGL